MSTPKNPLGKVQISERGFEYIDFQDIYGLECALQQSSLAKYQRPGSSAVWLGGRESRMHLDVEQAQALVTVLTRWLETGSFQAQKEEKQDV